ncbi:MAG: hypothetical protein II782_05735, partial [Oscillospiraceae bacterium]|nr:hypothetical protein [Oscillospiraceae bacterium]
IDKVVRAIRRNRAGLKDPNRPIGTFLIKNSDIIYADPLYRPICGDKTFVPVPHRAFSGRCFTGDL